MLINECTNAGTLPTNACPGSADVQCDPTHSCVFQVPVTQVTTPTPTPTPAPVSTPTPTPTPTPVSCGACSVTCGGGTKSCTEGMVLTG